MCGLAGFVNYSENGRFGVHQLKEAAHILAHRGPDDEGFLFLNLDNILVPAYSPSFGLPECQQEAVPVENLENQSMKAGLMHRRLSIIDPLPEGHQPFPDSEKRVWITFNGEIYNYKSLRRDLQSEGFEFHTQSDTEVLLQAWKKWGPQCVNFLDGMWAFVILDLNQNLLFASTDRAGIKPIYYFNDKDGFCFASEIKAFRSFGIHFEENPTTISRFLAFGKSDESEETFFKSIFRLKGGQSITIQLDSGHYSVSRPHQWKVNSRFDFQPQQSEKDWIFQIQDLLVEMISLRLQSDVPLGICLSGGIDSSTIAGLVAFADRHKQNSPSRKAFMARLTGPEPDRDWPLAQLVAQKCAFQLHDIQPDKEDFIASLEDLMNGLDEPPPGPNAYSQYAVFRAVKENGITVSLDGQGADEIFAGYPAHEWMAQKEAWGKGKPFSSAPVSQWKAVENLLREKMSMKAEIALWKWKKPELAMFGPNLWRALPEKNPAPQTLNQFLNQEFSSSSLPFLLKAADRNSMRWSVESRMPFTDFAPLVQLLFSIPGSAKWQAGQSKYLLRKAAQPFVPQTVLSRKDKVGFAAPNRQWVGAIPWSIWEPLLAMPNEWMNTNQVKFWIQNQHKCDVLILWRVFAYLLWRKKILLAQ